MDLNGKKNLRYSPILQEIVEKIAQVSIRILLYKMI